MTRKVVLGSVSALTLLGFALRFYNLNAVPLRGDEAFTVLHWMREPLAHTLSVIATVDPQAPLSYALYRVWALIFGSSEYVVRILPALLNVIGVPVIYALGHRLSLANRRFARRLGLLAALLWAINPYQIWHAQDARNYAIWAVLSPLAVWLALRALDKQRRIDWLLYIIAAVLAAYVYYLELFIVVALNLYVLLTYWRHRRLLLRWIGVQVVIGLILAPWYLQPRLLSGGGYGGTGEHLDPSQWISRFIPALTFGDQPYLVGIVSTLAPLPALVLLIGLIVWWRRNRRQAVLIGLLATIPLLLLGVVSIRLSVFEPRYVLGVAPAYTLLLAMLLLHFRSKLLRLSLLSIVVLISLFTLNNYYFIRDYAKSPDWRALATYLHDQVASGDWLTQASADPAFTFYCNEYQVPANCDDQLPANPVQSQSEIESLLTMRSQQHPAIWYVAQPPNWQNAADAENWLTMNMQQVRSTSANGLRVQEFKSWTVAPDEIAAAPLATFGDAVQLVGAQSFAEPTDEQTIWFYWRALKQTGAPLKIFLHETSGDQIVAQDDQYPQDGRISTTAWQIGTVYRDVYTLPLSGVPTGDYTLVVGFYDPQTNRRLQVGNGDSFSIQTIHVH